MIPATMEQVEAACARRSATEASRYLASIGLRASNSRCNAVIGQMIDEGRRGLMSTANGLGGNTDNGMLLGENVASCRALLEAMVRSYQRKADRLGISFEQAMATSNGNQAVRA